LIAWPEQRRKESQAGDHLPNALAHFRLLAGSSGGIPGHHPGNDGAEELRNDQALRTPDLGPQAPYPTLGWVDWLINRRLLSPVGNILPTEFEGFDHQNREAPGHVGLTQITDSL